ncbi:Iron(3+)-hydroxamate-binding protein FhuD [wastewater metagenome]|uniref:Iron(3+)-hydroxamate-binding protein FhuD n=2 Tax=unclassified sequences TaxID=12908 RepID=A0A5B8RJZ5_9ZZZZ|nr:ABC transporter substrate-binding protein [Arhodomonas sp. KWT]QEA07445.1 iron(3+)-hydroxamate-binding protein FhuD [uncultured organism]
MADRPLRATAALMLLAVIVALVPGRGRAAPPAVATVDWTLAETLLGLGVTPLAVAQVDAYRAWVGKPRLPDSVADLGLRMQPNMERLARLAPDRILISRMFTSLTPRLERIAPVSEFALYTPDSDTWEQMLALTRRLGTLVDREAAAERLIRRTREVFADCRGRIAGRDVRPLLMVQFMDARHVRVFGENGLYQVVLDRLGLRNAWSGPTNYWGFSLVGLEALAGIDARIVVIEPFPAGVERTLADNGLWQSLPSVTRGDVVRLPPVWSFGALPSARRFALHLVDALDDRQREDAH